MSHARVLKARRVIACLLSLALGSSLVVALPAPRASATPLLDRSVLIAAAAEVHALTPHIGYLLGGVETWDLNALKSRTDCSGFMYYLYGQIGVTLGGTTATQIHQFDYLPGGVAEALPGDLIFWGVSGGGWTNPYTGQSWTTKHVAMYAGNGKMYEAGVSGGLGLANERYYNASTQPRIGYFRIKPTYASGFWDGVPATVTGTPDNATIAYSSFAGATATVDPAPGWGAVWLQYWTGSSWATFSPALALTGGVAHYEWVPPQTFEYRFQYGPSYYSDPFTIAVTPPTVTGTADAALIPYGSSAGVTVGVSPAPVGGTAYVQYLVGSTWTTFREGMPVNGSAHFSWVPPETFEYRVKYGDTYSDVFTIEVVPPTLTATLDSGSVAFGGTAGVTVGVDPAPVGGTVSLQYLSGSTWMTFREGTPVNGSAYFSWVPAATFQYRAVYGTYYSDLFTVTSTPQTVTATLDNGSVAFGSTAGVTVEVDPPLSVGTVSLQYLAGSTWTTIREATAANGSAYFSWVPAATFQYRALYGTTYSDIFTVTSTPPTITATLDSGSVAFGGTAGVTVGVDPAPVGGTVSLQYLAGSTWTTIREATPANGSVYFSWVPAATFQYRAVYGTYYSDTFTVTSTPQTLTTTLDDGSVPFGSTAGVTVELDPPLSVGTVSLQYLSGTTWTTFREATPVNGSVYFSWVPAATFQYRAVYGTTYSDIFTVTSTPPTVTGTPDAASISYGSPAGVTVGVDPAPVGGTAYVQYLVGSTWTTFSPALTLTGGAVHYTWVPPATFQYRVMYGAYVSDVFTVAVSPGP